MVVALDMLYILSDIESVMLFAVKPTSDGGGGGASAKETAAKNSAPGKRRLIAQMLYGVLLWCFVSHLVF